MITLVLIIFAIFVLVLLFVIASSFLGFLITRVPYVRSSSVDTESLLSRVPMKPGNIFIDLGSGDGRVVFIAEQMYSVKGVGYELTFWTYFYSLIKRRFRKSNARFYRRNFFKESWSEASVIYCYLYPPLMRSVEEKFLADCKSDTLLISRDFPLPSLRPVEIVDFKAPHNAYIYKKT